MSLRRLILVDDNNLPNNRTEDAMKDIIIATSFFVGIVALSIALLRSSRPPDRGLMSMDIPPPKATRWEQSEVDKFPSASLNPPPRIERGQKLAPGAIVPPLRPTAPPIPPPTSGRMCMCNCPCHREDDR